MKSCPRFMMIGLGRSLFSGIRVAIFFFKESGAGLGRSCQGGPLARMRLASQLEKKVCKRWWKKMMRCPRFMIMGINNLGPRSFSCELI